MTHLDRTELSLTIGIATKSYYNAGGSFEKTNSKSRELSCSPPKDEACCAGREPGTFEYPTICYFPFGLGSVACTPGDTIFEKACTP